jgi:hypothetical protein
MSGVHFDLSSVYAPNSDEPLFIESAVVDIFSQKIWIGDPKIHGRGDDNIFTPPHDKTIYLTMKDSDGNTYKASVTVRELTINTEEREPS